MDSPLNQLNASQQERLLACTTAADIAEALKDTEAPFTEQEAGEIIKRIKDSVREQYADPDIVERWNTHITKDENLSSQQKETRIAQNNSRAETARSGITPDIDRTDGAILAAYLAVPYTKTPAPHQETQQYEQEASPPSVIIINAAGGLRGKAGAQRQYDVAGYLLGEPETENASLNTDNKAFQEVLGPVKAQALQVLVIDFDKIRNAIPRKQDASDRDHFHESRALVSATNLISQKKAKGQAVIIAGDYLVDGTDSGLEKRIKESKEGAEQHNIIALDNPNTAQTQKAMRDSEKYAAGLILTEGSEIVAGVTAKRDMPKEEQAAVEALGLTSPDKLNPPGPQAGEKRKREQSPSGSLADREEQRKAARHSAAGQSR